MEGKSKKIIREDRRVARSYFLRYQQITEEEYQKLNHYLLHENGWRGIISLVFFIAVELFRVYDMYHLGTIQTDFIYYWHFFAAGLGVLGLLYFLWTFPYMQKKKQHVMILGMYILIVLIFTFQEINALVMNINSKENFYCCLIVLLAFSMYSKKNRMLLFGVSTLCLTVCSFVFQGYLGLFYLGIGVISFGVSTMMFNISCSSELRKIRMERDNQNLKQVAYIDTLTQIQNRRGIEDYINVRLVDGDVEGYLYFIDIDNFKCFNDTYGHNTGDEVLRQVANTLHGVALKHNCKVCRYGGEEFLIVMPFPITEDSAMQIGAEIVSSVNKTEIYDTENNTLLQVTVSVGCSMFICSDLDELEKNINRADEALYYVKQNGKNGFHLSA